MKLKWHVIIALVFAASVTNLFAQDHRQQVAQLRQRLAEAQRQGDEKAVVRISYEAKSLLGDQAGVPEVPDEFHPAPQTVEPLTLDECRKGAALYLRQIQGKKWWKIGLDPRKTEHLPREVANVVVGAVAINRAALDDQQQWLVVAKDACNYLLWTQQQGGAGVFPFPHYVGGRGKAFESATRLFQDAEKAGMLDKMIRNEWVIDDHGDGGLQFDNGLCGVAILQLYEATKDERYLQSVKAAAEWAVRQSVVPNWNYNSFSVYLLAKAARATGERRYLESAKQKARLGVYPGQLTDGPHKGRWADPHNARPAYHYIIVRGLGSLVAAMDDNDVDRPTAISSLRLALQARNPDFVEKGIMNKDSSLEALLLLKMEPKLRIPAIEGCGIDEATDVLERAVTAEYRSGRLPLGAGVWGRFLEYKKSKLK
jgi:hypothetical protein